MKKFLIHILLSLFLISSFGQTQLLKEFDFNQGGYYLLGTFSESDQNNLRDSLGEFYTDDIEVLNEFQKAWVFTEPGKKYACGYHYNIRICKNGIPLKGFSINLNCNEIVSDEGYFYFDSQKLRIFYGKLKKPVFQRKNFYVITEARLYRKKILKDENLIMSTKPSWTKYEGTFQFEYECKEEASLCTYENTQKALFALKRIIKFEFPSERFELQYRGGSLNSIRVEVKCNQSLSDKFNLFDRDRESYFGTFTPYSLELKTYWKTGTRL